MVLIMSQAATLWQRLRTVLAVSRIGPFALVGLYSTIITIGLTSALSSLIHIDLRFAALIGYAAGMISSYMLNRLYVFKTGRHRRPFLQAMLFLGINAVSATAYAQTSQWLDTEVPRLLALCLAVTLSTIINYLGYRSLVFVR
jgi:putative flippase GtrA